MRKILIIIFLVVFSTGFCSVRLYSQTNKNITLLSFINNKTENVNIQEDWANQKTTLTTRYHGAFYKLEINNVQQIDTIYVLLKRFLIVNYTVRGGSGEHLRYTRFFILKNGILSESLSLLTNQKSYSPTGTLMYGYKVAFSIVKYDNQYLISLKEKWRNRKSISDKQCKLLLDLKSMVFYSSVIKRGQSICIDSKTFKADNNIFKVSLGQESYVYYGKNWYEQGQNGCFYKF